ncbi:MAG: type II toxin-antitoxin system HicA family toxin [Micavibrio aeruginosavorus]|uniref:Type II toxin-antitoxin system HicA family toxin n=1 Tax=Micavibrio aeruginosavorus TaxID=349221 RepID=A0A2W5MSM0_9BACT|nr:MAG: type II toxin-antitoxin system HicA family toxin [Micavibrio aeruginosavorus]
MSLYRDTIRILKDNGCYIKKGGKGSHERWYCPNTNITVTVPGNLKSRHTANEIFKQAGIDAKI